MFSCKHLLKSSSWVDRDMFMRYSGGGIGHQHESSRWRTADRGNSGGKIDLDLLPENDGSNLPSSNNDTLQLLALGEIAARLPENDEDGAATDSSDSYHSSDSDAEDEQSGYGTDDDEDDHGYFGPEDNEPIYAYDSDET